MTGMTLPTPLPMEPWMDHGACIPPPGASQNRRRYLLSVMFAAERRGPAGTVPHPAAEKLCAACPYQTDCLAYALKHNIEYGTWGGLTAYQRERVRTGRHVGAVRTPRKRPVKGAGKPSAPRYVNCPACDSLTRADVPCGCGEGS